MRKKYTNVIMIGIVSLLLIGIVIAKDIVTEVPEDYSWWSNFLYDLQEMGLFTSAGIDRKCDVYASLEINPDQGDYYSSDLVSQAGGSSGYALFGIYDLSWNLLNEYRSEDVGILRKTTPGIIEVYCCPYEACDSNDDCNDPWGNICNTVYGSCYYIAPSHSTKVYECISGSWDYQRNDDFGDSNWCLDPNHNNYIREGQTIGGCYSTPPIGWCVVSCATEGQSCGYSVTAPECCAGLDCQNFQCVTTGECSPDGDEICGIIGDPNTPGELLYECVGGSWISQGKVDGKCGYSEPEDLPPILICSDIDNQDECEANDCFWDVSLWGLKAECIDKDIVPLDLDFDGDGYSNQLEEQEGTDPYDPTSFPTAKEPDVILPIIPSCIGEEEIFYTKGQLVVHTKSLIGGENSFSGSFEVNPGLAKTSLPLITPNYFTNKATACCENLTAVFVDREIGKLDSSSPGVLGIISILSGAAAGTLTGATVGTVLGPVGTIVGGTAGLVVGTVGGALGSLVLEKTESIDYSFDTYKCVPEGEEGFCLEFAHTLLNPYTHTSCQNNSIILIVLIVFGFIMISRFAGCYGVVKYEI